MTQRTEGRTVAREIYISLEPGDTKFNSEQSDTPNNKHERIRHAECEISFVFFCFKLQFATLRGRGKQSYTPRKHTCIPSVFPFSGFTYFSEP